MWEDELPAQLTFVLRVRNGARDKNRCLGFSPGNLRTHNPQKNTAFFNRSKSAPRPQSTFVPRDRNARATFLVVL